MGMQDIQRALALLGLFQVQGVLATRLWVQDFRSFGLGFRIWGLGYRVGTSDSGI